MSRTPLPMWGEDGGGPLESGLPLAGVRVVEFTLALAGSYAVRFWGNYGAEVIKVESRTYLDFMRNEEPRVPGREGPDVSQRWNSTNGDKLGITLNMNHPRARELALRLVATADVVLDNLVTGIMERWGLTYDALRAANESIIVLSMPVMGRQGPRRNYRGFGPGIAAIAGLSSITGEQDFPPSAWATPYPDFTANPYHAAAALLAALHYRHRTGKGQFIDLAQYEATINLAGPALMQWTINHELPPRRGNREPGMAPHGVYRCRPGSPVFSPPPPTAEMEHGHEGRGPDTWVAIAVGNDEEWRALCAVMGDPEWAASTRFATLTGRMAYEDELDERLEAWTADHTAPEVMHRLQRVGIAAGVVESMEDLLIRDPQIQARGVLQRLEHPAAGPTYYSAPTFQLSRTPFRLRRPAPMVGQHNDHVFGELLGLHESEIAALTAEGAFE